MQCRCTVTSVNLEAAGAILFSSRSSGGRSWPAFGPRRCESRWIAVSGSPSVWANQNAPSIALVQDSESSTPTTTAGLLLAAAE